MAYSANKTKLFYKTFDGVDSLPTDTKLETLSFSKDNEIRFLMEVPEFGATPEKIDVTTLGDSVKKYIPGIKDYGDLVFKFLYEKENDGNYRLMKKWDDAGKTVAFQINYPDDTAHVFTAIPAVKMDAGAINGALTFSSTMLLQSTIVEGVPAVESDPEV